MPDMLVRLFHVQDDPILLGRLTAAGIQIKRVLAPDRSRVLGFIETHSEHHWPHESKENWLNECTATMSHHPPSCFIAVKNKQVIGFACYNATAKGFFGPMGVLVPEQGKGVGKALLVKSLLAMWEEGYGYAIIGWPARSAIGFYEKTVNATLIENSSPGVYSRMIDN